MVGWVGGRVSIIGNNANSVQLQLQLPTGTELGNMLCPGECKKVLLLCTTNFKIRTMMVCGIPRLFIKITGIP